VLERGLDIKAATVALVEEAFGSWKVVAKVRMYFLVLRCLCIYDCCCIGAT
jgi:hypothetical protein